MTYLIAEDAYSDRSDKIDRDIAVKEEELADNWLEAVGSQSLKSKVDFDSRSERSQILGKYRRPATVYEIFTDVVDYHNFHERLVQIAIDSYNSGNDDAIKLFLDMSRTYAHIKA
jgi:hypothetical protein